MTLQQKTEHWQAIFAQQTQSGLSIAIFCREHKLHTSSFYNWRKRLAFQSPVANHPVKQKIIPLIINDVAEQQSAMIKVTTANGYQLEFDADLSPQKLSRILGALQ